MRHFCGVLQAFTAFPEIKFFIVSSARSELDSMRGYDHFYQSSRRSSGRSLDSSQSLDSSGPSRLDGNPMFLIDHAFSCVVHRSDL